MTFDASQFLDTPTTDANATAYVPVPEGDYAAVVAKVDIRPWTSAKDPSKSGIALDLQWSIDDAGVRELLGRDTVMVKQGIMLDLNESGGIDTGKGKNVNLGRLREALGLNVPGKPFTFRMLEGQVAKVHVTQRIDDDKLYNDVKSVAKM